MSFANTVSGLKHSYRRHAFWAALGAGLALSPARMVAQAASRTLPLAARTKGAATAPVTVYEMADFQCPVCRRFMMETFPALEKEFVTTGKVKWIFINYPLTQIHANAMAAAEFAVCAAQEGKFWPAHDMLYGTQEQWERLKNPAPFFQAKIPSLGLKTDAMASCLQSGTAGAMVRDDAAGAERAGARSTPNFFIEGGLMEGLYPLEVFRHILDSVYKVKTTKKP